MADIDRDYTDFMQSTSEYVKLAISVPPTRARIHNSPTPERLRDLETLNATNDQLNKLLTDWEQDDLGDRAWHQHAPALIATLKALLERYPRGSR